MPGKGASGDAPGNRPGGIMVSLRPSRPRPQRRIIVFRSGCCADEEHICQLGGRPVKRLPLINAIVADFPIGAILHVDAVDSPEISRIDEDVPLRLIGGPGPGPGGPPPEEEPVGDDDEEGTGGRPPRKRARRHWRFPRKLTPCYHWRRRQPSSPSQNVPWGISFIGAPAAWTLTRGGKVAMAVIDTGVDLRHPDLRQNLAGGYNALSPGRNPQDDNGHGTHVAGTVGSMDNDLGVVGVAPEARLHAVKVLDRWGSGLLSDLIEGLGWCINEGIRLANLSLGTSEDNASFHEAIRNAYNAGMVLITAAGNEGPGENNVTYPARYAETIAVSAINEAGRMPRFASRGPEVDLIAPGVDIYSTWPAGRYRDLNGTSMASPHAAGAAALLLALNPDWGPTRIKDKLIQSGVRLPGIPYPILNVAAAVGV